MRRFLRILINTATAFSLALFLAGVAMWARSPWWSERLYRTAWGRSLHVVSVGQIVWFGWTDRPYFKPGFASEPNRYPTRSLLRVETTRDSNGHPTYFCLGFAYSPPYLQASGDPRYQCTFTNAAVPYWSLAMTTGLLPCIWISRRVKQRYRERRGRCLTCGYDCRATPDRCPECGAVPEISATVSN